MAKIEKTLSSPYGGISEQSTELMLDTQCVDMVNCVPDIVLGTQRRNGTEFVGKNEVGLGDKVFHFYYRGEGEEVYFMCLENSSTNPIRAFKPDGTEISVAYENAATAHTYLESTANNIVAITVQDRTFIANKNKKVGLTIVDTPNLQYDKPAYYWLKRASNDDDAPYRYAVYLDGVTYQALSPKSDDGNYTTYDEASRTYTYSGGNYYGAAKILADSINASGTFTATVSGSILKITKAGYISTGTGGGIKIPYDSYHKYVPMRANSSSPIEYVDVTQTDTSIVPVEDTGAYKILVQNYQVGISSEGVISFYTYSTLSTMGTVNIPYYKLLGSNYIDPLTRAITIISNGTSGYFTFDSWDSWGNQASKGWQGSVNKLSDLPDDFPFTNTIVKITGTDNNNFTDYFVIYDGNTWIETFSPSDNRGELYNMPIYIDRLSDGTFYVGNLEWETNHVGDASTCPTPSFVNNYINDILFYKNRLGFSSGSAVTLSETGGYYNFYSKTVLEVVDDDPIDLNIPSGEATYIYYAVPYQKYLFLFTQYAQYALTDNGSSFSPATVSIDLISSVPMDVTVRPIRANSSLYFISKLGDNKRQLREYKYYDDSLIADGINLSIQTPNLLPDLYGLNMDISAGYVTMTPTNDRHTLYCYKFFEQGNQKAQSAFFKFTFNFEINKFTKIDENYLYIIREDNNYSYLLRIPLAINDNDKIDIIDDLGTESIYNSYFTLPKWNVKTTSLETSDDRLIIKRLKINGTGKYNVDIYRKDYNTIISRTYDSNSMVDNSASILGKNKYVEITIKGYNKEPFRIDSLILEGMYTQTNKETN